MRLRVDQSLSGLSVSTGRTLRCVDSETDPRVDRDTCRRVGAISMVCAPLTRGEEPFGVLKVTAAQPRAFTAADVGTLTTLADFITAAIAAASDLARITGELVSAGPAEGVPEFVANVLQPGIVADVETRRRIEHTLEQSAFAIACQPIFDIAGGELVGAEALARFAAPPRQGPDAWFEQAQRVGLGVELELATLAAALSPAHAAARRRLPRRQHRARGGRPPGAATELLEIAGAGRIVLELTEHLQVEGYDRLRDVLFRIRGSGVRLAIDDTGAGFAGLDHILRLAPDVIKLDRTLTGGIDIDPVRRALAGALVRFAGETGAQVLAEGIETADELATVRALGIQYGQGYLLGRPGPVEALAHTPATATAPAIAVAPRRP